MGHYDDCRDAAAARRYAEERERAMARLTSYPKEALLSRLLDATAALRALRELDPPLNSFAHEQLKRLRSALEGLV